MAYLFDAAGEQITGGLAASLATTGDFTLAFWVKGHTDSGQQRLASLTDAGNAVQIYTERNWGNWDGAAFQNTNVLTRVAGGADLNAWTLLVWEFDEATETITAYRGDEATAPTAVGTYVVQNVGVGDRWAAVPNYIIGATSATGEANEAIEHICLASRKLTAAERTSLHEGQNLTGTGILLMLPLRTDAVAVVGGNGTVTGATTTTGPTYPSSGGGGGSAAFPHKNVSDTFNRPDNTTLGNADSGQLWRDQVNTWGILANQAVPNTRATSIVAIETTLSDMGVEATMPVHPSAGIWWSIVGRYSNASNFYFLQVHPDGRIQVRKTVGGTASAVLAADGVTALETAAGSAVAGDVYRLEIQGTALRAYQNGVEILASTDSSLASGTMAGMRLGEYQSTTLGVRWENFSVYGATAVAADTTPPTVSINVIHGTGPAEDIYSSSGYDPASNVLTVTGTAVDETALDMVQVVIDNGVPVTATGTTSWSITVDVADWTAGTHTIEAIAYDSYGNPSTPASRTVWHSPDGLYGAAPVAGEHLTPLLQEVYG